MLTRKEIGNEIIGLFTLNDLVKTYEEIAASRMQKTRSSVIQNRSFVFDLGLLYQDVKSSYRNQLISLMQKKKIKDVENVSLIKRNGKTVVVFVAANTRLYGDLIQKNLAMVRALIAKGPCDLVVIGKLGLQMLEAAGITVVSTYFDFSDQVVDVNQAGVIAKYLQEYERILVVHGQFFNVISQDAVTSDMSGDLVEQKEESVQKSMYIFEPSLEKIVLFFEQEIFASLFEQVLEESHLAKFASRMINLDLATERIQERVNSLEQQDKKYKHLNENKKQLNSFSSMMLWEGR